MDYTLSTFLPECSLSQEPKTRQEIEKRLNMPSCNTSMPLLMHAVNAIKNGLAKQPQNNNFVGQSAPEPVADKPLKDDLLWDSKNMDLKQHLDADQKKPAAQSKDKSPENKPPNKPADKPAGPSANLATLNDLPPLTKKKGGLEPLEFNPKEEDKFSDSVDKEKQSLEEVDKKLKEFEAKDAMKMPAHKPSPDKKSHKFGDKTKKKVADFDDYEDDFEDDIVEDLPVEDYDASETKDKNPEFTESGVSASQSYGMDPSVTSLDIEGYDHVEQAILNSPYKM